MQFIKTFEELKALKNGTIVHHIRNGNYHTYIIVGTIPQSEGLIVVDNDSYKNVLWIYESAFKGGYTNDKGIYTTEYDPKEFGEIMIKQIHDHAEKEIEDIMAIYLKS